MGPPGYAPAFLGSGSPSSHCLWILERVDLGGGRIVDRTFERRIGLSSFLSPVVIASLRLVGIFQRPRSIAQLDFSGGNNSINLWNRKPIIQQKNRTASGVFDFLLPLPGLQFPAMPDRDRAYSRGHTFLLSFPALGKF